MNASGGLQTPSKFSFPTPYKIIFQHFKDQERIIVLDGATGQNAHSQVSEFSKAIDISGLIITKLDGTAKGGVVVALAKKFGIPIHAVGVGEEIDDRMPFIAEDYAKAILGIEKI